MFGRLSTIILFTDKKNTIQGEHPICVQIPFFFFFARSNTKRAVLFKH